MSKFKKIFKAVKKIASSPIGSIGLGLALPGIGSALGASLGIGSALGTGLAGAGAGLLSGGGLKGALLGGVGGYLGGGGLGSFAGAPSGSLIGPTQNAGSGLLGAIGNNSIGQGISSLAGGGAGSSYGSIGGNLTKSILSAGLGTNANDTIEEQLLKQQKKNAALYAPFLNAKFTPGDLTQDPGYQFRLGEGERALGRKQSAAGNYFSGQALKEAQDYGQGLADSTYNDAYQRFLAQQGQNMQAAGAMSGVNDNIGNIQANKTLNNSNLFSQGISNVFGGPALSNTGAIMGGNSLTELLKNNPELLKQFLGGGGLSSYAS